MDSYFHCIFYIWIRNLLTWENRRYSWLSSRLFWNYLLFVRYSHVLIISNVRNTVTLRNMKRAGEGIHFHTHIGAASVSVCPLMCIYRRGMERLCFISQRYKLHDTRQILYTKVWSGKARSFDINNSTRPYWYAQQYSSTFTSVLSIGSKFIN